MAEIVNLRMARKRRDRGEKDKAAADARTKHGVSKAQRESGKAEKARADRELDGARRELED